MLKAIPKLAGSLFVLTILAACDSDRKPFVEPSPPPEPGASTPAMVSGNAQLGVIVGGIVSVQDTSGNELASDVTDPSGNYGPIELPASHSGPVVIEISPATDNTSFYVCDYPGGCPDPTTSMTLDFGVQVAYTMTLSAVVADPADVNTANVTPISTAVRMRAEQLGFTADAIAQADSEMATELSTVLGITVTSSIATIPNVDLVTGTTDADSENLDLALALSALNAGLVALISPTANDTLDDVVSSLASGFAATGQLGTSSSFNSGDVKSGEVLYGLEQQLMGMANNTEIAAVVETVAPGTNLAEKAQQATQTRNEVAPVPPQISGTPTTTIAESSQYSFRPEASDPDGTSVSFEIANKPSWLTFDAMTGELTGVPTDNDVGTASNIIISAVDAGDLTTALPAFSITVTNVAPTLSGTPPTSTPEDAPFSFTPTSAGGINFSITNKPSWATFNTQTGQLSGTPTNSDVGTYTGIVIGLADSNETTNLGPFSLTVTNVNDAPAFTNAPATSVDQDVSYTFTPVVVDVDNNAASLSYSIQNKPSWMTFSTTTGVLSGTPADANVGVYNNITITVTDGLASTPVAFNLTVNNINDAPSISGTPSTSGTEDVAYSFLPSATDPDTDSGDILSFSINKVVATDLPWATFSNTTGLLTGTPGNSDVGSISNIVISVTDSSGVTTDLPAFNLTIANEPLAFTGFPPPSSVNQDAGYSFTPSVSDAGDIQSYSITGKPSWATFSTTTGALTGTPTNSDVGNYNVQIDVTDGNETTSLPFSIAVNNVNDPPVVSGTPDAVTVTDIAYSFTPTVTDPDQLFGMESFTWSIQNQPAWNAVSFDTMTGQLSGTPDAGDIGTYNNIMITATDAGNDGAAESDTITFSIEVVSGEQVLVSWTAPTTRENGSPLTLPGDLSGYTLSYYEQSTPGNVTTVSIPNTDTMYTTPYLSIGTWHFAIKAIESSGFEGDNSTEATVAVDGIPG